MAGLSKVPNGRLDRIKAGARSITIQTEFFEKPSWKVEIKVYVDGALKKLDTHDLSSTPEDELQKVVDQRHQEVTDGLVAKLKAQTDGKS